MKKKVKKKRYATKITEDIWYYQNERSLDFVVWQKGRDGNSTCVQFRLYLKSIGL